MQSALSPVLVSSPRYPQPLSSAAASSLKHPIRTTRSALRSASLLCSLPGPGFCERHRRVRAFTAVNTLADEGSDALLGHNPSNILDNTDEEELVNAPPAVEGPIKVSSEVKRKAWALRSVLKVFVNKVDPNYAQPWQMCPQRSATGSAFVIDNVKRQILTNSHVISNATAVYVRRPGLAKKFKADVIADAKVCDLALLTVKEDAFWDCDMKGLQIVDVPELQSPISVVGYPVGGDSLSITKGIVSRLTLARYSPAARLMGIQIDAAINPGNSGGPAFANLDNGEVAGVAFSKNVSSSSDNIGYIIPLQVVRHFLDEYESAGCYIGVPSPGFQYQDMENPSQRAYLKVPESRSGVLISKLDSLSPAAAVLKEKDVVMVVDGIPVADDGTVVFRDDERLDFTHLIRSRHVGDILSMTILREEKELDVSYELKLKDHLVPMLHKVDCVPSYFIVGGLVFMPLTQPFLEMVFWGSGKRSRRGDIPVALLQAMCENKEFAGKQIVVLVQVLAHEINHGYKHTVVPCETFNGIDIKNLRHLADMVDGSGEQYMNFGLEGGRLVTLDRLSASEHGPNIMQVHAIPADRSEDLRQPLPPQDPSVGSPAAAEQLPGEPAADPAATEQLPGEPAADEQAAPAAAEQLPEGPVAGEQAAPAAAEQLPEGPVAGVQAAPAAGAP